MTSLDTLERLEAKSLAADDALLRAQLALDEAGFRFFKQFAALLKVDAVALRLVRTASNGTWEPQLIDADGNLATLPYGTECSRLGFNSPANKADIAFVDRVTGGRSGVFDDDWFSNEFLFASRHSTSSGKRHEVDRENGATYLAVAVIPFDRDI